MQVEIVKLPKDVLEKAVEEKIGAIRQWLNEDRITDPTRLVSNEEIKHWLRLDSLIRSAINEAVASRTEEIVGIIEGMKKDKTSENSPDIFGTKRVDAYNLALSDLKAKITSLREVK